MGSAGPIIEVAGIDGAGKTTLASSLSGHFIGAGRVTYVRSFHSWVRRWCEGVSSDRGLSRAEYFGLEAVEFATAVEMMERTQMMRRAASDGSIFVLDPYTFCSAAMAASYEISNLAAVVETYLCGERPDLIVYLDIGEQTAMQRIHRRPSVDNLVLSTNKEPPLSRFRAALEQVAPMFSGAGVNLLRLNGEDSVELHVKAVVRKLNALGFDVPER